MNKERIAIVLHAAEPVTIDRGQGRGERGEVRGERDVVNK